LAKVRELSAILNEPDLLVRPVSDVLPATFEVEETGTTFEENAWLKAEAICAATGLPALADDSGIEVDALGGRPGVYSARYAGVGASDDENNALLLRELAGVPRELRGARFVCVLAFAVPSLPGVPGAARRIEAARETIEGLVTEAPRGTAGFGYDPLFECFEFPGKTTAEISPEQKNAISHRGRASQKLRQPILSWLRSVEAAASV
jgi:XTP/dITP diphosphohydrolase